MHPPRSYAASQGLSVDVRVDSPPPSRLDTYGVVFQGPGVARFPRGQTQQHIYDTPRYPVVASTYTRTLPDRKSLPLVPTSRAPTPDIWRVTPHVWG
jgi:hypothetical protein